MQLQAAYLLSAVHNALNTWATKNEARQLQLQGLWCALSTFDVVTTIDLQAADEKESQIAVATNLLTRGLPTLPSVYLEEQLCQRFRVTEREDNEQFGSIAFSFSNSFDLSSEKLFAALHPIVPDPGSVAGFYDETGLDSHFEKAFVTDYLKPVPFLAQLLEKQRPLETLVDGFSNGRIDFSVEVPYRQIHSRINKFNRNSKVRHNHVYAIEVDGEAYHKTTIDEQRDFAVANMGHTTNRIKERTSYTDAEELIKKISVDTYIQKLSDNFSRPDFARDVHTRIVLVPVAIARIQRTVLSYLMSAGWKSKGKATLKLAVLERDIEAAEVAIDDLTSLLETLDNLSQEEWARPQLQCKVYKSSAEIGPLLSEYDLVLDTSLLRRTGIFAEDREFLEAPNVILLRSSHYVDDRTTSPVISAKRINYYVAADGPVTTVTEKVDKNIGLVKLLQDIFRKKSFRVGQLPILKRALNGKSVIGLLPTGGGKSLTYQLAALLQPGLTVVVDPIRSLMADQDRSLRGNLIDKTTFVNSTLSTAERTYVQDHVLPEGRLHFLFISPERFVIEEFRNVLARCGEAGHFTSYIVIDEAHCVSEWGHDFRIPYLNLGENAQEFCPTYDKKPAPLFGLTATASFDVLADIERELKIQDSDGEAVVRFENTVRDEINYAIEHVNANFDLADGPFTKYDPNKIVGTPKQERIFKILQEKKAALQPYDDYATIRQIAQHSYDSYLSDTELRELEEISATPADSKEHYCNKMAKRVWFGTDGPRFSLDDKGTFSYGMVIFAPHRTGWLGINNGSMSTGIFGNGAFVQTKYETLTDHEENEHQLPTAHLKNYDDKLGYFMGSSDDDSHAVAKNDLISFTHMDRFTANENSLMVATKAFGMGIDKPNIRATVHVNMPSSIESYVQEAGRGGRDRKSALSVVLFNDEKITYTDAGKEHTINVDQEVLNFFHKRSFKGQLKERTMLYELRKEVLPPKTRRKVLIVDELQNLFPELSNLKLNYHEPNNRLYLEYDGSTNAHYLSASPPFNKVWPILPFAVAGAIENVIAEPTDSFASWWNEWIVPTGMFTGVEVQFQQSQIDQGGELNVHFTNQYYSKPAKEASFHLNENHLAFVYDRKIVAPGHSFATGLKAKLREAVFNDLDYQQFIGLYDLSEDEKELFLDEDSISVKKLQRAFYANRGPQETAKAIYRLSSIGIIDTYTIDYNNRRYNLRFTKHEDDYYFGKLQELIARYTSNRRADVLVDDLRIKRQPDIDNGIATPISVCLEYLTSYIYDNIRRKRKQAITDMIALCRQAIKIDDKLQQNLLIKDEIFYYFNAKYSRPGFVEPERNEPASMPDDHVEDKLTTQAFISKYLDLVEDSDTGEFVNNNKHLRGSCMRMLRSYVDAPQYTILKSFSLFVMSATTLPLRQEAVAELSAGLLLWKRQNEELDYPTALIDYRQRLSRHVAFDLSECIAEAINVASVRYYADWLHNFNNQLTPANA